jgi:hypothetical protein
MNIKYTKESFTHKPDWVSECKRLHWKLHQGGFYDYIYLWQTGHIMDIGDNDLMDFIIVDIDDLPEGKREWLNTHTADIANALDVKSCHVFDSSSRKPGKCKVFLELFVPVPIKEMETVLTDFEIYCDVTVDKCTKSPYQLNFGIMLDDPKYKLPYDRFAADIPSARTTKISKETFLPVNQQEKNRLLGKKPYTDPRLEWKYYRFTYKDNVWHRNLIVVPVGKRHKVLNYIVTIATFNACLYNDFYNRCYNYDNVYNKVCSIVALQFDKGKEYLAVNRNNIYRMCYNEWNAQHKKGVPELYVDLCRSLNMHENYSYKPREFTAKFLYDVNKHKFEGLTEEEVIDQIGYIAEGEENIAKTILRYYRKEFKLNRSDKGKSHAYTKRKSTVKYEETLKHCIFVDNVYYIPKKFMDNNLRKYCSRNKIRYKSLD